MHVYLSLAQFLPSSASSHIINSFGHYSGLLLYRCSNFLTPDVSSSLFRRVFFCLDSQNLIIQKHIHHRHISSQVLVATPWSKRYPHHLRLMEWYSRRHQKWTSWVWISWRRVRRVLHSWCTVHLVWWRCDVFFSKRKSYIHVFLGKKGLLDRKQQSA